MAGNFCISYLHLLLFHMYSMIKQIMGAVPSVSLTSCMYLRTFCRSHSLFETGIHVGFLFMYSVVRALVEMLQS